MHNPVEISTQEVYELVDASVIDKANGLISKTAIISNQGHQIKSVVSAASGEAHHSSIQFNERGRITGKNCSCGEQSVLCVHSAAALLKLADDLDLKNNAKAALAFEPSRTSTRPAPHSFVAQLAHVAELNGYPVVKEHANSELIEPEERISAPTLEQFKQLARQALEVDQSKLIPAESNTKRQILWNLTARNGQSFLSPYFISAAEMIHSKSHKPIDFSHLVCTYTNKNRPKPLMTPNFDAGLIKDLLLCASAEDMSLFGKIFANGKQYQSSPFGLNISNENFCAPIARLCAQRRLYALEATSRPLQLGFEGEHHLSWSLENQAQCTLSFVAEDGSSPQLFNTWPVFALNRAFGQLQFANAGIELEALKKIVAHPKVSFAQARALRAELAKISSAAHGSAPDTECIVQVDPCLPVIHLKIRKQPAAKMPKLPLGQNYPWNGKQERMSAELSFQYGEAHIPASFSGSVVCSNGYWVEAHRNSAIEKGAHQALMALGFCAPVQKGMAEKLLNSTECPMSAPEREALHFWSTRLTLNPELADTQSLFEEIVPQLEEAGWIIDDSQAITGLAQKMRAIDSIETILRPIDDWFELDIGVQIGNQRHDLAPLLSKLFQADPRWLNLKEIEKIEDTESIELRLDDHSVIVCPASRIKPFARNIADLILRQEAGIQFKVEKDDLERVQEAVEETSTEGLEALRVAVKNRTDFSKIMPIEIPSQLNATLRSYQKEGLDWMQHLARHNLAGILADDMGLGKTVQCLAHILAEKEAGRLTTPALAIMPTSLVFNWVNEAKKFTPTLNVLVLHGSVRHDLFNKIAKADLVISTYPLLWRDEAVLIKQPFHLLFLDEAQNIKNIKARASRTIRKLQAKHKVCVTGTPIENNLGELYSQFDFLLPGFLGTAREFRTHWARPIEKQNKTVLCETLARKIKPFLLRRLKEDVAPELPPKTISIRSATFGNAQRDLYESTRVSMDARVREIISKSGFAKSQIVILDALLKLRQVCNDPRLCKTAAAARVSESAKIEMIKELVHELIGQKRKILIFSQFVSMLNLIEPELKAMGLKYSRITGETKDREEQVRRFQEGETSIFLISLKAGGTGLNLVAADTVIHVDPWWNPAVENQATDRAHRIGQEKPVLVLKLVIEGSIEEKILILQDKKAKIAGSVLSADQEADFTFSAEDVATLLAPMPLDEIEEIRGGVPLTQKENQIDNGSKNQPEERPTAALARLIGR